MSPSLPILLLSCSLTFGQAFLIPPPTATATPASRPRLPRPLQASTTIITPALQPTEREKQDRGADGLFYSYPRLCTHVDDNFISQLTDLYRKEIPAGGAVLDLMSSWISHLPAEFSGRLSYKSYAYRFVGHQVEYSRVDGHGLNMEELRANPRLSRRLVQDINKNATLPFESNSYDAVLIACSVQYLQKAETVLQEIHRVLKPQGKVIISFSNRMFFEKAINAWINRGDIGRVRLVSDYISSISYVDSQGKRSPGFAVPMVVTSEKGVAPDSNIFERFWGAMMRAGPIAQDPFFVVIGSKLPPVGQ